MSVGFAKTTQNADDIISNFFKQNHTHFDDINRLRDYWYQDYKKRGYNPKVKDLLDPEYKKLDIRKNPKSRCLNPSRAHIKQKYVGYNGLWSIKLNIETFSHYKFSTFTINALVGKEYRFHPAAIEENIVEKYGSTVYNSWKGIMLDDIGSLKLLVDEIRKEIKKFYYSVTCCDRSSRLCERVGIPVRNGHAFLFPEKVKV